MGSVEIVIFLRKVCKQFNQAPTHLYRILFKIKKSLKWLVTQKFNFFVGFPYSVQDFLHIFDRFCGFLIKKGTNCGILNINNRWLMRLKVHVMYMLYNKKVLYWWGKPYRNISFLSDQSLKRLFNLKKS